MHESSTTQRLCSKSVAMGCREATAPPAAAFGDGAGMRTTVAAIFPSGDDGSMVRRASRAALLDGLTRYGDEAPRAAGAGADDQEVAWTERRARDVPDDVHGPAHVHEPHREPAHGKTRSARSRDEDGAGAGSTPRQGRPSPAR